jgi:2-methylisocitrate lyase-like PEP mutase family enzyme
MPTQADKAQSFRELHVRNTAFVIPNPWDIGSARVLAHLGFEALATTSAGFANSLGKLDNAVGRDLMLEHVRTIVDATDLPVSADLENGFGDESQAVAKTIALATEAGLCGASIEDSTQRAEQPIYDLGLAIERIRAASEVAHRLPYPFTLTARCENYLVGRPDLADTIARLQAYQAAGADVLYAPGLTSQQDIATLVREVDRPVNVLVGIRGMQLGRDQLSAIGVRRISVGSGLYRAAFDGFFRAAQEMRDQGTFDSLENAISFRQVAELLRG